MMKCVNGSDRNERIKKSQFLVCYNVKLGFDVRESDINGIESYQIIWFTFTSE